MIKTNEVKDSFYSDFVQLHISKQIEVTDLIKGNSKFVDQFLSFNSTQINKYWDKENEGNFSKLKTNEFPNVMHFFNPFI